MYLRTNIEPTICMHYLDRGARNSLTENKMFLFVCWPNALGHVLEFLSSFAPIKVSIHRLKLSTFRRSKVSVWWMIIWISLKVFFPKNYVFSQIPHIFWWDVLGKYSPVFSLVANMVVPLYSMTKEIVSSDLAAVLYAGYNLHSQYLIFLQKCISRVPKCCLSRLSLFPPVPLMSINLSHHQPPPNPNLSQAHINLSPL